MKYLKTEAYTETKMNHSENLLFLPTIGLVVCQSCKEDYYPNFRVRPYEGHASCQLILNTIKTVKSAPDNLNNCLGCFTNPDKSNILLELFKNQGSLCEEHLELLKPPDLLKQAIFNGVLSGSSDAQSFKSDRETEKQLIASGLYFERLLKTLNYSGKPVSDLSTYNFINSYISSYIPEQSIRFLSLIGIEQRLSFSSARREEISKLTGISGKKLDNWIGEIIIHWFGKRKVTGIIFLLWNQDLYKAAISIFTVILNKVYDMEEIYSEPLYKETIEAFMIKISDFIAIEGDSLNKTLRQNLQNKTIQLIGFESQFFELLIDLAENQMTISQMSNSIHTETSKNSGVVELIEEIQVRGTSYLYNEISQQQYLEESLEDIKLARSKLNSSYLISKATNWFNSRESSISLSTSEKLSFLFSTNTVKSALNTLYILDEMQTSEKDSMMREFASFLADLSFDCFEVALFIFISIKPNKDNSIYLHRLHSITFEILISLSQAHPKFKTLLIDLNLPVKDRFDITYIKEYIHKVLKMNIYSADDISSSSPELNISIQKRKSSTVIEIDTGQQSTITLFLLESLDYFEQNFKGKQGSTAKIISEYAKLNPKLSLKYSNYIFARMTLTLNQFFNQTYLKKQVNDSEIDSPIFFHKDLLLKTMNANSLDVYSKLKTYRIYLNELGSIGCSRFCRSILGRLFNLDFNFKANDGKLPLRFKFAFERGEPHLGIICSDNLKFNNEELLNTFIDLTYKMIERVESLKEALILFRDLDTVLSKFQREIYFSGSLEKIKNIYSLIIKRILGAPVEFENAQPKSTFENISRFKVKGETIIFENQVEHAKKEAMVDFETTVMINSSNKTRIRPMETKMAVSMIFYDLDVVSFKRAVANLKKVFACSQIENIPDALNVLLQMLSQSVDLFFAEIKDFLPVLMSIFFYVMLEFTSSFNKASLEGISSVLYEIITKTVKILKTLVDYNRMKIRREVSELVITINFDLSVNERLNILQKSKTFDVFSLMNTFLDGIMSEITHICTGKETKAVLEDDSILVSVLLQIIDLMRELLEGNSAENIKKMCVYKSTLIRQLNQIGFRQDIARLIRALDKFYFGLYLEAQVGEEEQTLIEKILPFSQIEEKMISSFETALEECFCSVDLLDKNAVNSILTEFYSDRDKALYNNKEFQFSVSCFVFLKNRQQEDQMTKELATIWNVLSKVTRNVEINIDSDYKTIYFIDSPENTVIKSSSKAKFVKYMDRSNSSVKKQEIVDHSKYVSQHINFIYRNGFDKGYKSMFNKLHFNPYLIFMLSICLVNIIAISAETVDFKLDSYAPTLLRVGCSIQIVVSLLLICLFLSTRVQIEFDKAKYNYVQDNRKIFVNNVDKTKIFFILLYNQKYFFYPLLIVVTAVITIGDDKLYWVVALQLLTIVHFSENLKNVVRAVHTRSKQLILVTLFMSILLLIFGLMTFVYLNSEFTDEEYNLCQTPMHCFTSQFDFGLRMGGGMGDFMPTIHWQASSFWKRFFFAQAHYAIFPIVMLNIVAGIIIDTFADLREKTQWLQNDIDNVCVICSREKSDIERKDTTFLHHVNHVHRVFNYIYFIIYIESLKEEECDYYQTLVRKKLEEGDLSWFPDESDEEGKKLNELAEKILGGVENQLGDQTAKVSKSIDSICLKPQTLRNSVTSKFERKIKDCDKTENALIEYFSENKKELLKFN